MSDHPKPPDDLSDLSLLLKENQELLRQNAQLLAKIGQMLEQKLGVSSELPAKERSPDEDDREFYMGL